MTGFEIVGLINAAVGVYEVIFAKKKKSGKEKKKYVTKLAKDVIAVAKTVSTGGQKKSIERIEGDLSNIIDSAAAALEKEGKI